MDFHSKRKLEKYSCCKNPYAEVHLVISLRREAGSYTMTLVMPSFMLSGKLLDAAREFLKVF